MIPFCLHICHPFLILAAVPFLGLLSLSPLPPKSIKTVQRKHKIISRIVFWHRKIPCVSSFWKQSKVNNDQLFKSVLEVACGLKLCRFTIWKNPVEKGLIKDDINSSCSADHLAFLWLPTLNLLLILGGFGEVAIDSSPKSPQKTQISPAAAFWEVFRLGHNYANSSWDQRLQLHRICIPRVLATIRHSFHVTKIWRSSWHQRRLVECNERLAAFTTTS